KCSACSFDPREHIKVEDIRVSPHITITQTEAERSMQAAAFIGSDDIEPNQDYELIGTVVPHPKTQQTMTILSSAKPIDNLKAANASSEGLEIFRPNDWSVDGIHEVLNRQYTDFEDNVCKIYG